MARNGLDGFYPTPVDLIIKMVSRVKNGVGWASEILEPSAGKGDIVDYLVEHNRVSRERIYCIEKNPDLRASLVGKGYQVIGTDFLQYNERYSFDLVLMNPPFDQGEDHLLKAWEILRGGQIVCLLNAETLRNPSTAKRKLLRRIIEEHGSYEEVGRPFTTAQRPTNVEVVMVILQKEPPKISASFDGLETDAPAQEQAFSPNLPVTANLVEALVTQYNAAAEVLAQSFELDARYVYYTKDIMSVYKRDRRNSDLNEELKKLKLGFWRYIFNKTRIGRMTTSNFRKDFEEHLNRTAHIAFTVENIMAVLEGFIENRHQIVEDCIVEVFDRATKYHDKNTVHTEGWKTNKSWKVAKTIILPSGVRFEYGDWDFAWWGHRDFLSDIDKALCFLLGRRFEDIRQTEAVMKERFRALNARDSQEEYTEPLESEFFKIRFYKKGTVHLTFRDLKLLAAFNQAAAKSKGWVGPGY